MKERTIIIDEKPFTYQDEVGDPYVFDEMDSEDGRQLLLFAKTLFDELKLDFFLVYGTLLGAVREQSIIPGDDDVDIAVVDENKLFASLPWLYEKGLYINRIFPGELYSFHTNRKGHIDVYILKDFEKGLWSIRCKSLCGHAVPGKYFSDFSSTPFCGEEFPCPANPEKLLEWHYGKNWRIPQNKKGIDDVFLRRVIMKIQNLPRRIRKKIRKILAKNNAICIM